MHSKGIWKASLSSSSTSWPETKVKSAECVRLELIIVPVKSTAIEFWEKVSSISQRTVRQKFCLTIRWLELLNFVLFFNLKMKLGLVNILFHGFENSRTFLEDMISLRFVFALAKRKKKYIYYLDGIDKCFPSEGTSKIQDSYTWTWIQ